jgi:hypothetical protein
MVAALLPAVVVAGGCNSCQEARSPGAVPPPRQEERLHPAVEAAASSVPAPECAVVGAPSVERGVAPLEIHFTAEGMCTDAEGTFTWDFGDGTPPVEEQNPVHVYQEPGTYTARVTLTNRAQNARDTDAAAVVATPR